MKCTDRDCATQLKEYAEYAINHFKKKYKFFDAEDSGYSVKKPCDNVYDEYVENICKGKERLRVTFIPELEGFSIVTDDSAVFEDDPSWEDVESNLENYSGDFLI